MERRGSRNMAGKAAREADEPSGSERVTKSTIENDMAVREGRLPCGRMTNDEADLCLRQNDECRMTNDEAGPLSLARNAPHQSNCVRISQSYRPQCAIGRGRLALLFVLAVREGLSKALLWLWRMSFAYKPCA